MPRPYLALTLALALPVLVVGCTGAPVSVASNTYPNVPPGLAQEVNLFSAEPLAVWTHGHTILAVITVGSEECPPVPTSIEAPDASTVAITFVKSPNSPCTANASPTTHEFKLPAGLDAQSDVIVEIHFAFDPPVDYSVPVEE